LLAGILNFNPSPTALQVAVWVGYLAVVGALYVRQHVASNRPAKVPAAQPGAAEPVGAASHAAS
jgi:high-affinity iron transporter